MLPTVNVPTPARAAARDVRIHNRVRRQQDREARRVAATAVAAFIRTDAGARLRMADEREAPAPYSELAAEVAKDCGVDYAIVDQDARGDRLYDYQVKQPANKPKVRGLHDAYGLTPMAVALEDTEAYLHDLAAKPDVRMEDDADSWFAQRLARARVARSAAAAA